MTVSLSSSTCSDKIIINNISIKSYIGVDHWEKSKLQPILISVAVEKEISKVAENDSLDDVSFNYSNVAKDIIKIVENNEFKTMELVVSVLMNYFKAFQGIHRVTIKIVKKRALLFGKSVGIKVTRSFINEEDATDVICIDELSIPCILGINAWEREEKQNVLLSMEINCPDLLKETRTRIPDMYNYKFVAHSVFDHVASSSFKTIEALAYSVISHSFDVLSIPELFLTILKPSALLDAEAAGICIHRKNLKTIPRKVTEVSDSNIVYIAFGSNIDDRFKYIDDALKMLHDLPCTSLLEVSNYYESSPMYYTNQNHFINGVCKIKTCIAPVDLLQKLKEIECKLGRIKEFENGPRTIDLDILFYNDLVMKTDSLIIPHPRICEREFVLRPFCDLEPLFEHPVEYRSIKKLLALSKHKMDNNASLFRVMKIRNKLFHWGKRTYIMGILNVTPDSFSDGGKYYAIDTAVNQAMQLILEGADVIDIGGMSTRPNSDEITEDEEIRRVLPVIKAIRERNTEIPLSIDTFRSSVAEIAIDHGVDLINDVSGGTRDPNILKVAAAKNTPICLMHLRGNSKTMNSLATYQNLEKEILQELECRVQNALQAKIPMHNIIIDPGIGFSKSGPQNIAIIKHLSRMMRHDKLSRFPWLVGPSRKRFIGDIIQNSSSERDWGTGSICCEIVRQGAQMIRVHNVKAMKEAVAVADVLFR